MTEREDAAVAALLEPMGDLEPDDAAVRRLLARDTDRRPRRSRAGVLALLVAVLGTATYAVPVSRGALGDVYSSLAPWAEDGAGTPPGRSARSQDALPEWLSTTDGGPRVLAEQNGVRLVVARERDDSLTFLLGDSVGLTETVQSWRARLKNTPIAVLGPASFPGGEPLDTDGRRALLGLVAASVRSLEVRYATGEPTVTPDVRGGFVVLVDASRRPTSLVAFDARGRELGSASLSNFDPRVCQDVRGCPPGRWKP